MFITTTPGVEGRRIVHYAGVVTGEAILGANIIRDYFESIRDIVGGRAAAYEDELRKARQVAIDEATLAADERGANAIVGVSIRYETVGERSMLMVCISGTAVVVE